MSARATAPGPVAQPAPTPPPAPSAPVVVERRATAIACRALDVLVAAVALLVLAPLLAVLVVAIRLDSRGPGIYRQRRIGRHHEPFTVNKLRTMYTDAGHETHRAFVQKLIAGEAPGEGEDQKPGFFKIVRDPRVTRVGHFLRKSSIDELPQLWNVLMGHMSLVGPRPPLQYEVDHYPAHWHGRFAVKPGITGLWQVGGRSETTLEEMIELDLEYVRTRSFWLNVKILLRTIPVVLSARGAA